MNTIENFIENKENIRHHGVLLLSHYFSKHGLPDKDFQSIAMNFCGISLQETNQSHPDIFIADRERKILRLEDIKAIQNLTMYPPQQGQKRFFYIENCERLNNNAANALLKVLEEPPTPCLFLMTCSKLSDVLPTITSRVQKIAVSFSQEKKTDIYSVFSSEDLQWIKNQIDKFELKNYSTPKSLIEAHSSKTITQLSHILSQCEKITKAYEIEDIRSLLVHLLQEKVRLDVSYLNTAKFLLNHLSQWKNVEHYHPSTALWLNGFFLLF